MSRDTDLDHVAVCVRDLDQALRLFQVALGLPLDRTEDLHDRGIRVAFLGRGSTQLELVAPLRDDSEISGFLEKRGEGLHHVALKVKDLDSALEIAESMGYRVVGEGPQEGAGSRRVAFLHPKTAHGVLVELVEVE